MELNEFKQKFSLPRITAYIETLSEEQINWFWELLWSVKQVFPKLDIYHAGSSKYGYLGFGRKKVQAKRVEDFFFVLHLEKNGNFILYITDQTYRLLRVDEDVLPQGYDQSIQNELNLKSWLNKVKTFTEELDLDYSGEGLYPVNYEVENYFTTLEAYSFLKTKYQKIKEATKKIVGFRNNSNQELALILENSRPSLFIGVDPEDNQYFKFNFIDNNSKIFGKYDENEGRHDGLKSHAPSLYKGNKAYYIEINSLNDLEKFCEWYELDVQNSLTNSHSKEDKKMPNKPIVQPLNRILFGAAGTGKTFNTINHALAILEGKDLTEIEKQEKEPDGRTNLKGLFDKYKNEGRIKFVTFHQSFSYEDFVEGIRAETEKGILTFEKSDGIFKLICVDALKKDKLVHDANSIDELINNFINEVKVNPIILQTKEGKKIDVYTNERNTLMVRNSVNSEKSLRIKYISNYLLDYSDQIVLRTSYEWAVATFLLPRLKELVSKPYVLIIDEINRGNISRIFGELITLIEDSKRQGAEEELSVTLPYSKEEFSVPSNVYIIGTMNSSDRSLTGLDIALRRRFTFVEMPPKPELLDDVVIDGLNIGKLLKVINQRIEVLLDRDHCIGHANFMSLKQQPTLESLAHIFKQKIIPQLQEYFFDDWAKINMVLNANGMLKPQSVERSLLFPNVDIESDGFFEEQKTWQLVNATFDSIDSFAKIIKH